MLRISATTLESFRLFTEPDQEWMTEDAMLATIRGEFVPTPAVELGRAFGLVLETPERYRCAAGYRCGEFHFNESIEIALAAIDRRGIFEAKAEKVYGDRVVVSKADHLLGAHLSEFKSTSSTFDFDKYAASCQWRFMADAFEPLLITYRVFELDEPSTGLYGVRQAHTFNLFPYPDLRRDCLELLDRFCEYVHAKGLEDLLHARQRKAEAA